MTRPNIIWIYCDELRTDALGCYGNRYIQPQTPNIDAIAASGMQFNNCFCNSPVCVASRTSILTGLYPEDTGVYHNEAYWPGYQLDDPPQTFPEVFAAHGYTTANFGKTHVPKALRPWRYSNEEGGSMRAFFDHATEEEIGVIRPPDSPLMIGGRYPAGRPYPPERITENALDWMATAEGPYMVRFSYLQPHTPVFPQPPYDTLYDAGAFHDTIEKNQTGSLFERRFAEVLRIHELSPEVVQLAQAHYYGLVAWIDSQVGRILDFLRRTGQVENSIIVFDADHGTSLGEMGRYQKQTFAPESHRVPRLLSWPGTIDAGQVCDDVCGSIDLARTLFALTGIQPPSQFKGIDLLHQASSEPVYATIGYGFPDSRIFPNLRFGDYMDGHGWPRRSCIRTNRYRLDKNVRMDGRPVPAADEDIFFVDLEIDPQEVTNRADDPSYAEVISDLNGLLDAHIVHAVEPAWAMTHRT